MRMLHYKYTYFPGSVKAGTVAHLPATTIKRIK